MSPLRKRHPTFDRIATSAPVTSSSTLITTCSSINNLQTYNLNSTRENSIEKTNETEPPKLHKFVKILYNSKNTKEDNSSNLDVEKTFQRLQTGSNPTIIKTDCVSFKTNLVSEKVPVLNTIAAMHDKLASEETLIEENQSTVGHGRGEWAKDILVGKKDKNSFKMSSK